MAKSFREIFPVVKPVIGMIHLAGDNHRERVERALDELRTYEGEGVNGVIIENYLGPFESVVEVLRRSADLPLRITRGVNVLKNPYSAFALAREFRAEFVQFDSTQTPDLDMERYATLRATSPNIFVLGGVRFKGQRETGRALEEDLADGMSLCDAIVTTGTGTGFQTPLPNLASFRKRLGNFPLLSGSGVTPDNIRDQLAFSDGVIVGTYFKPNGNDYLPVDRELVRELMDIVREERPRYTV